MASAYGQGKAFRTTASPRGDRPATVSPAPPGRPHGRPDRYDFAHVLVADLAARAIRDTDGARWSNVEHRATPSDLEPRTGWAMGNAGIVRELLRFVRLSRGGDPRYAFAWPDQPPAPARATTGPSGTGSVP